MVSEYEWKNGFRSRVPAQVVGERLESLRATHNECLTPHDVVEDARPKNSPLHPCFEWDDSVAANLHREEQARQIIRNVYVVHRDADGTERPVLGYINVNTPDEGRAYITTARAMSEPEMARQVEEDALAALNAWRKRYAHIKSLGPIFRALDLVLDRKCRKPARRQPVATP